MLKKWIENIKTYKAYYDCECWKYNISGNQIEFSVLPRFLNDKEKYRCSVICIGQVIQALTCRIENAGLQYHIQSFPNLEDPSLVAAIRINKQGSSTIFSDNKTNSFEPNFSNPSCKITIMTNLAEWLQFNFVDITSVDIEITKTPINNRYTHQFALLSEYDNPFTWLKIGYWKEMVQKDCKKRFPVKPPDISNFCFQLNRRKIKVENFNDQFVQAVVTVETNN